MPKADFYWYVGLIDRLRKALFELTLELESSILFLGWGHLPPL